MHGHALFTAFVLLAFAPPTTPTNSALPHRATETELGVKIVPPDGLYEVTITPKEVAPKGERVYWNIYPRKGVITTKRNEAAWTLKVPPGGSYEASYTTYINNEQVDSFVEFSVGDGPGPSPVPPGPLPPTDPFTVAIQSAYTADTGADRAASLAFLHAAYVGMAANPPAGLVTNNDVFNWMKSVVQAPVIGLKATQLAGVREVIAADLAKTFGASPTAAADLAKVKTELSRVANALAGVK